MATEQSGPNANPAAAPPSGAAMITAILEGTEDQRRMALGAIGRHAKTLAERGTLSPGDVGGPLLDVLRAQRGLLSSSRERLQKNLREIGPTLAAACARLIPVTRGADLHLVLELARALRNPDLIPAMKPVLDSPDRWAAMLALQAIAATGGGAAFQAVVDALAVEDLRWTAVALLADGKAVAALPVVARLLADPSPEVRIEVLRAFLAFKDPRVIPLLQKTCVRDPEQRVRDAALGVLRRLATAAGVKIDERELKEALSGAMQSGKAIDRLLRDARLADASDVHIIPGSPPAFRVHGELVSSTDEPLTAESAAALIREMLPAARSSLLAEDLQADFSYVLPGVGRHRVNVFSERRGLSAVIRLIPKEAPSVADLGLPPNVKDVVSWQQGLVIVTGRAGAGKTTTMAALVSVISEAKPVHIITLEDPIEYLHERKRGLVNQREIGRHSASFPAALRAALREDPDVIVVGEMRDITTMRLAVEAAETGHLVIATLHTPTAIGAVQRLIESFPATEQQQVRLMLSDSLRLVIAQQLLRRASAPGRVGCFEILVATPAIGNLIRENKLMQIAGLMQTGKADGQRTFDAALMELLQAREISPEDAYARAVNKDPFRPFLKGSDGGREPSNVAQNPRA